MSVTRLRPSRFVVSVAASCLCATLIAMSIRSLGLDLSGANSVRDVVRAQGDVVTGTVILNDGSDLIGDFAGTVVTLTARLSAESQADDITSMRYRSGYSRCPGPELSELNSTWMAFTPTVMITEFVWSGLHVYSTSAQFEDSRGNRSGTACDDILIEGHSPTITPEPTVTQSPEPTITPTVEPDPVWFLYHPSVLNPGG